MAMNNHPEEILKIHVAITWVLRRAKSIKIDTLSGRGVFIRLCDTPALILNFH
jgi:hypothetical protein